MKGYPSAPIPIPGIALPARLAAITVALSACALSSPSLTRTAPSPYPATAIPTEATITPTSQPTPTASPGRPELDIPPGEYLFYLVIGAESALSSELDYVALDLHSAQSYTILHGVTDAAISPDGLKLAYFLDDRLYLHEIIDEGQATSGIRLPTSTEECATPIWSPDSKRFLISCGGISQGTTTILVEAESATILEAASSCRDYSWSPGGEDFVASCGTEMTDVRIVSLTTSSGQPLTGCQGDVLCNRPKWSPFGEKILFYRGSGRSGQPSTTDGYYLADLGCSGPPTLCTYAATDPITYGESPVWSPDGSQFAIVVGSSVVVANTLSGKTQSVATLDRLPEMIVWSSDGRSLAFSADSDLFVYSFGSGDIVSLASGEGIHASAWIALLSR